MSNERNNERPKSNMLLFEVGGLVITTKNPVATLDSLESEILIRSYVIISWRQNVFYLATCHKLFQMYAVLCLNARSSVRTARHANVPMEIPTHYSVE